MSRPYFEEVQKFRDNRWIWVIVFGASLSSILPLANGEKLLLGTQNLEGIDWAMKRLMTINEPI